ncbi:MAG: D-alanine--D-alanine ligase [Myxococcota bacterium]
MPGEPEEDGATAGGGSIGETLLALERWRPDVAFIAMHGPDGEDGRVQGALEMLGIAYQGSGIQASAVGLDKVRTKAVYRAAGLPVAKDRVVSGRVDWRALAAELGLPLVLKTPASGSSVGVVIATTLDELAAQGQALVAEAGSLLCEQYVHGREFTAPVVEGPDGTPSALPAVEIRPVTAAFFDYVAKYTPGATDELCPAPIDPVLEAEIRALGLAAHRVLGCRGYSRTDLIVRADGRPVLLETNTLPGLTAESLLPKSAAVAGLPFPALVQRLLERARAAALSPRG